MQVVGEIDIFVTTTGNFKIIIAVQGTRRMRRPSIVDEVVVAPAQAEAAMFPACAEAVSRLLWMLCQGDNYDNHNNHNNHNNHYNHNYNHNNYNHNYNHNNYDHNHDNHWLRPL